MIMAVRLVRRPEGVGVGGMVVVFCLVSCFFYFLFLFFDSFLFPFLGLGINRMRTISSNENFVKWNRSSFRMLQDVVTSHWDAFLR